jgi:hypothetical protein
MKSRGLPLAICALGTLVAISAASHAYAQSTPNFGTRSPRVCNDIKVKPTPEQAAELVQCHQEYKGARNITLLENVQIQMGGPQPYNYRAHSQLTGVDTTSQVYPLRGSYVLYGCDAESVNPVIHSDNREKNCSYVNKSSATGYCWKTTFGNWDCSIVDIEHNDPVLNQPPPRS